MPPKLNRELSFPGDMPQPQDMVKAITAFEARSKNCLFFREICATLTGISEKAFWEKIGLAFAQKKGI